MSQPQMEAKVTCTKKDMSEKKYSFRNEIKYENQKAREEQAKKDFKRNMYGLNFSAIVFFFVLLVTLNG